MILLCLHGWGGDRHSFDELRAALDGSGITILTPDLPGFGDEPEPTCPWTTDDYANWVVQWFHQQLPLPSPPPQGEGIPENPKFTNIEHSKPETRNPKLILLGHSHGGRIALKLSARQHAKLLLEETNKRKNDDSPPTLSIKISHLVLCASAGIRHPRHFKRILGLLLAKSGKFFLSIPGMRHLQPLGKAFLYKLVRVHDYENASPIMRQTLINVTAEDLRPILSSIKVPTAIFWGEDDRMTPVEDAYLMHKEIQGSTLTVFPEVRHRVHRDRAGEIAGVIAPR